jgi:hypothetical protein
VKKSSASIAFGTKPHQTISPVFQTLSAKMTGRKGGAICARLYKYEKVCMERKIRNSSGAPGAIARIWMSVNRFLPLYIP